MSYINELKDNLKNKRLTSSDIMLGCFLAVVSAIIPLISKLAVVNVSEYEQGIIRVSPTVNDIFSYNKSVLILIMGVVIVLFMAFQMISGDGFGIDFKNPVCIAMLVFVVFAIVSAIASPYKTIAFKGISERYEGLWVLLCYVAFLIVSMNFAKSRYRASLAVAGLCLSALLLGLIGCFQAFGLDIFDTDIAARLVLGDSYTGNKLSIRFDSVYATLYNPNCAGMYFGMMFSFTAVTAAVLPFKNKLKYLFGFLAILTLAGVVGSDSAGGFMGVAGGICLATVVAVVYYAVKFGSAKVYAICIAALVVLAGGLTAVLTTDNMIAQKINVITESFKNGMTQESPNYFKDFYTDGNKGVVVTDGGNVTVLYDKNNSQLMLNDEVVLPSEDGEIQEQSGTREQVYYLKDDLKWTLDTYENVAVLISEDSSNNQISFIFVEDNGKLVLGDKFAAPVTEGARSIGFKGYERLGSNRGYIWSRSIPLLAKNIFIGQGPDCFVFDFPQNDVRAKLNYLANPYVIVDKPHNMYLQTGINTGVVSLVIFVGIFVFFIIQTVIRLFKSKDDKVLNALRLGIVAGTTAYMLAGLTTDSVVSVAPVFWIMLGTGFGLNLIKTEKVLEEK